MAGKIKLPHECPKCKKDGRITIARTTKELEEIFGLRQTSEFTITNQSWCRECRKKRD